MKSKPKLVTSIFIVLVILAFAFAIYLQSKNKPYLSPIFNSLNDYFKEAGKYTSQLTDQQIVQFIDNQISVQSQNTIVQTIRGGMTSQQIAMVARGTIEGQSIAGTWSYEQKSAVLSFINNALASQQAITMSPYLWGTNEHDEYFRIRKIIVPREETFSENCNLGSCGWVNCNSLNQGQICVCSGEEGTWSDWIQCDGTCIAGAEGSCKEKVTQ